MNDDRLLPTTIDDQLWSLLQSSTRVENATIIVDYAHDMNESSSYYTHDTSIDHNRFELYYRFICLHLIAFIANAFIMTISIMHRRRAMIFEKISQLLLNQSFINCLLISTCYLIHYIMISIEDNDRWMIVFETLPTLHLIQSLSLFHVAFDRYLSLFVGYTPHSHRSFVLVLLLPYVIGAAFDHRLLINIYRLSSTTIATILTFMHLIPTLFAFVLIVVVLCRQRRRTPNNYRQRKYYSIAMALFIILFIMIIIEKCAYFSHWLLAHNYEHLSSTMIHLLIEWYHAARCARQCSALYIAVICLCVMTPFRRTIVDICNCKRRKIDYNRESLRSIIGGRLNVLPRNMIVPPRLQHSIPSVVL